MKCLSVRKEGVRMDIVIVATATLVVVLVGGIGAMLWHARRLAVAFEKHRS